MVTIDLTGKVLKHRYCILEQIGKGGNGSVYLARDMELGVLWAVKELPIEAKQEARLLLTLEHHCLPRMVDYAENGEYCYIIMERIKGRSLGERLRSGEVFALEKVLAYGIALTEVLGYLHNRRPPVFYGDLKPDNVMLSDSGKLYLVDFGSAVSGYRKWHRVCAGTEGFAAPEQYEGQVSAASDVYALGKTLGALLGEKRRKLLWSCPGLAYVLFKCCREKEAYRYQDMGILEKKLSKLHKKSVGGRMKRLVTAMVCVMALGGAAVCLRLYEGDVDETGVYEDISYEEAAYEEAAYEENGQEFYAQLTEVTELYHQEKFLKGSPEQRTEVCREVEEKLQRLSKLCKGAEEKRRLQQMLLLNSEAAGENTVLYYIERNLDEECFGEDKENERQYEKEY